MKKRLLVQCQLSNYNNDGMFILECDSGWQMVMGRIREMLKLNKDLDVTVMGPTTRNIMTYYDDINPDLWHTYGDEGENRLHYFEHRIIPNALVTRYDFNWTSIACDLDLGMQAIGKEPRYDAVYINDPMHLRAFKAMFHVVGKYQPNFYVHSHFIDSPSCPKFPKEASMWLGQCEAAIRADYNFWQCRSSMNEFFKELADFYTLGVVDYVKQKSDPWDDGYSSSEINNEVNVDNMRFTVEQWNELTANKKIVFFPNRISPSSNDYTNGMKFMFDILPNLRNHRKDFVVVCGNPNQKFSNAELKNKCGMNGYISLTPDSFTRDEFKFVAKHSDVVVGLYDKDAYGGTASRECIDLGCIPLWLDLNEYSSIARDASVENLVLTKADFSDIKEKLFGLFSLDSTSISNVQNQLRNVVRKRCSYEETTLSSMKKMNLL